MHGSHRKVTARILIVAGALILGASLLCVNVARAGISIEPLAPLAGSTTGIYSYSISENGRVAGSSYVGLSTLSYAGTNWESFTAIPKRLNPLFGNANQSIAASINDGGWVAGATVFTDGHKRASLWDTSPLNSYSGVDLGIAPGATDSEAFAVNNKNQAVGWNYGQSANSASVWSYDGVVWNRTDLLPFASGTNSKATAINGGGDIAGWSVVPGQGIHAAIWNALPGGGWSAEDLGTLAGQPYAFPSAINRDRIVVGYSVPSLTSSVATPTKW
jgi:uncharacterized membrane protein